MKSPNAPLLVAPELTGRAFTKAHADAADEWMRELFADAIDDPAGLALVAVGGYGRRSLWPYSDLDVILVHRKRRDIGAVAEKLWYPVWDRGLKLGHTVATVDEAITLASTELERATAFLDTRLIAGDMALLEKLDAGMDKLWKKKGDSLLVQLATSVDNRHKTAGDVSFMIEPNLKEGRGGLRDIQALRWASRADPDFAVDLISEMSDKVEILHDARVELHRHVGRAGDVLTLDDQEDIAAALKIESGGELMTRIAQAGRRAAWISDEAWDRWRRARARPRRPRPPVPLSDSFEVREEHIELRPDVDPSEDPLLVLQVAELAASRDMTIGRASLSRLRDEGVPIPEPWTDEARALFADFFLAGAAAIKIVEDLDHFGLMVRLLPEWSTVQCKPQRNVLHTFTVDRHLCEAAANASALVDHVVRPDLLIVGTLLHDIGKGYPGDHTEVGIERIEVIGERMGYPDEDLAVLVDLCRLHLLLPDVATRRDLSDGGTIRAVAAAVDSVEFLHLLAALTQADSIATGPSTWSNWTAGLLEHLVQRTELVLRGGHIDDVAPDFPRTATLETMSLGKRVIEAEGNRLTVVAPDEPLLFSRIAGVLAVHGLDVLDALAFSDDAGMAANEFIVQSRTGAPVEWQKTTAMVNNALDGRLALTARVAQRARTYARYQRRLSAIPARRQVNVDNDISDIATVVDVHGPDHVGLLYRVTQALGEFGLDIRSAKVQTMGPEAVDSFYICDRAGGKLTDTVMLEEIELALRNAMGEIG